MHDRVSVNQICFLGEPIESVVGQWRELGARRVSLVSGSLLGEELPATRAALGAGAFKFETINHVFLTGRSLDASDQYWPEERAKLTRLIEIAAEIGAGSIYMLTGGRGALTWEAAAEAFSAAIASCVAQAREAGIALMIENAPALYADIHIAHTLRDAIALAELADIGVCIEVQACWAEADLRALFERAMPRCGVIQVSDYVLGDRALPSRAVPGDGVIPLKRMIDWALNAGYAGAFDLELIGPRIDAEGRLQATRRAADHVSEILHALGA
jgi:sugar phosphate isomerase/epimerase